MFKNLIELTNKLNSEQACIDYLAAQRWQDGKAVCVYCGHEKCYRIEGGKRFKCANKTCYKRFHVTVGTIFHASNISLQKWFMAIYIATAHKKGISSYQLGKDIGVSQKTAWFMLHRIREGMRAKKPGKFKGVVEADETYMGRKYRSDYKGLTEEEIDYTLNKRHLKNKGAVLGIAERETGKVHLSVFDENNAANVRGAIKEQVEAGSTLMTDEFKIYRAGLDEYNRRAVFHAKHEWVRNEGDLKVHINTVENFWSIMKRGVYGIYHQISYKHLQRYCDEFSYRYNSRKIKDNDRFTLTLSQVNTVLPYKLLVHGKGSEENNQTKA